MNLHEQALHQLHAAVNRFGGVSNTAAQTPIQRYQDVQAMHTHCTIRVPRVEVTLHPNGVDPRDLHWTRDGRLTDDQTQRMYELLMDDEKVIEKAERIAEQLARGEIA